MTLAWAEVNKQNRRVQRITLQFFNSRGTKAGLNKAVLGGVDLKRLMF